MTRSISLLLFAVLLACPMACAGEQAPQETAALAMSGAVACGGAAGDTCPDGHVCWRHWGTCDPEGAGRCVVLDDPCPAGTPVCSCNLETWPSACAAVAAGVSVLATGACPAPPACPTGARVVDGQAANASDTGPCDADVPCATIQAAVDGAGPGTEVCVRPGAYPERVHIEVGGEAGAPLVVESLVHALTHPDAPPVPAGETATTQGFDVLAPWVHVRGFRIQSKALFNDPYSGPDDPGGVNANWGACSALHAATGGVAFVSNHVVQAYCNGVRLEISGPSDPPSVVRGNRIDDTGFRAIELDGDGAEIRGNVVATVTYRSRFADVCMLPEADGISLRGAGHRVVGNRLVDLGRHLDHAAWQELSETGEDCGEPPGKDWPVPHVDCLQSGPGVEGLLYDRNLCHIVHTPEDVGDNSPGHAMRLNAGVTPITDLVVRNNVFASRTSMALSVSAGLHPVQGVDIVNNTFLRLGPLEGAGRALRFTSDGPPVEDVVVRNNLFVDQDSAEHPFMTCDFDCADAVVADTNLVWWSGSYPPGWYAPAPGDILGLRPEFEDEPGLDLRLVPGSPGHEGGVDLAPVFGFHDDLRGRVRVAPWDLGAHETGVQ